MGSRRIHNGPLYDILSCTLPAVHGSRSDPPPAVISNRDQHLRCTYHAPMRTVPEGLKGLISEVMSVMSLVQFSLVTRYAALLVQLIREIICTVGILDGPLSYLDDQSTPKHVAQEILYITNILTESILRRAMQATLSRNYNWCHVVPSCVHPQRTPSSSRASTTG
ncbi:hypothetical protein EDB92DRAFT_1074507 [Lactarius akahatsu]|uniref:Uncharacterized protein n=1 Tax=Lactarius akahatsu TaxID=416441 RepID=A0AAD4LBT3_9AGAM|nr:hypothetical protein EDB92DRAFT_1074507 [Lactarius akahatsu]